MVGWQQLTVALEAAAAAQENADPAADGLHQAAIESPPLQIVGRLLAAPHPLDRTLSKCAMGPLARGIGDVLLAAVVLFREVL